MCQSHSFSHTHTYTQLLVIHYDRHCSRRTMTSKKFGQLAQSLIVYFLHFLHWMQSARLFTPPSSLALIFCCLYVLQIQYCSTVSWKLKIQHKHSIYSFSQEIPLRFPHRFLWLPHTEWLYHAHILHLLVATVDGSFMMLTDWKTQPGSHGVWLSSLTQNKNSICPMQCTNWVCKDVPMYIWHFTRFNV